MRWGTICFDLDNTLFSHEVAFEKSICFCFQSLLKEKKLFNEINLANWFSTFKHYSDLYWSDYETGVLSPKEYRRKRFLHSVYDFQLPFTNQEADDFHEHYYCVVDDFSEPFPYLYEMMEKLVTSNVKVGIITNGMVDTQYNKITKLKLNEWLSEDSIFISEQLQLWKPDRKIFDYAKEKLKSKGNCLFVGDSWDHDVVGAIGAGWDAIYLNTRDENPKTTSYQPILTCYSLKEVATFIDQQNKLEG